MKKISFALLLAGCAVWWASGCAHLSTTVGGDTNRVISGTVNVPGDLVLPADTEVLVRLVDPAAVGQSRATANKDLPVMDRPRAELTAQVLGEQTIKAPPVGPVAFRIEYSADDSLLRHGLNLEARISFGGRVRFRTVTTRAVTPGNASDPHAIWVEAVAR